MPIFRIGDRLHYFAHVPKCGGTSVEAYLVDRFGPIALCDVARSKLAPQQKWTRTSPQHIPAETLRRIVPHDWLASSFAVVRHPVRRLISAFFYARDRSLHLPLATEFDPWFAEAAAWIPHDPFRMDGHFAPQTTFVPDGSRVFRLEDGLHQVIPYLDALAGNSDGPRDLPALNIGHWRGEEQAVTPAPETLALIQQVYAADFQRFSYDLVAAPAEVASLPDLPPQLATGRPPEPRRRSLTTRIARALYRRAGM